MTSVNLSAAAAASPSTSSTSSIAQDLKNLEKALQSGDTTSAQQALTTLKTDAGTQGANPSTPLGKLISTVGSDLKNNDVPGAQQALSAFKEARHSGGGHHHGGGGKVTSSGSSSATTSAASLATLLEQSLENDSLDSAATSDGIDVSI